MENKKSWRSLLLYLGIPIVIIIIIVLVIGNMPQKTMKYSEILNYFETQQVTEFDLDLGSGAMVLTLNDGDESKKKEPTQIQYSVPNVTILYEDIKPYIEEYNKDHPDAKMVYNYQRPRDNSWLTALQTERLEQKAQLITQRLALCNRNWEDAFFITLARNFGFGLNGDAFETWAGLLPFRAMDKHRNDLFQIEAFFYGLAGLLEETFLKKEQEDEYSLRLCKEFRYLQRKFEIGQGMDATLWRFLRLRPENFPHIRLAQLAYLYQKGDKLFSRLLEAETLADVRTLLDARTSPYWENHYLFGRLSSQKEKAMGERSKDLIIINTVVPFLYTYGLHKADERMFERAGRFLEELKAESNHIIRSWSDAGLAVVSAADSQALIQLQKEYCDKRKCLYCRFGYEYLKHT